MNIAKNLGFFVVLPIALGFLPWFLDRRGVDVPNWLISLGGCVVFGGIAFGFFYPLVWVFDRVYPYKGQAVPHSLLAVIIVLCVVTTLAICWWILKREGETKLQPAGEVKTELRLQFFGDNRQPTELHADNISWWRTLWTFHAIAEYVDARGNTLKKIEYPKSWVIFLVFEKPTRYKELTVSFSGPGFPQYEVKSATDRCALITISQEIPAGALEIYAKP